MQSYKPNQWYRGGYNNRFYYYFFVAVNGRLVGCEYDNMGSYAITDAWDDEAFSTPSDATFIEVDKDWDPLDNKEQEIVTSVIKLLWRYCQ